MITDGAQYSILANASTARIRTVTAVERHRHLGRPAIGAREAAGASKQPRVHVILESLRSVITKDGLAALPFCLFEDSSYRGVWGKLTAGLEGLPLVRSAVSSLSRARRRIGAAPALSSWSAPPPAGYPPPSGTWATAPAWPESATASCPSC
ncbi:transposase domain-containing protein [Streptomyces mirabilis]|uniref:transposase domain-containing protein n=1 Tax=Streptomyces mirabilis TaxID=68239 RepID=UPI0036C2AA09